MEGGEKVVMNIFLFFILISGVIISVECLAIFGLLMEREKRNGINKDN